MKIVNESREASKLFTLAEAIRTRLAGSLFRHIKGGGHMMIIYHDDCFRACCITSGTTHNGRNRFGEFDGDRNWEMLPKGHQVVLEQDDCGDGS